VSQTLDDEDSDDPRSLALDRANADFGDMVRRGRSYSGNERNCCFLNTAAGPAASGATSSVARFANISATSGIDVPDDGRALLAVDWDHDGDLDVWLTNRTGPRVQMLRNQSPAGGHHFLAVMLEGNGRTSNRDAIGARVEVVLRDAPQARLVKSLAAGSGFLSQSSKWRWFGLGKAAGIRHVDIRWPDGSHQRVSGVEVDRHYRIVQGDQNPRPWAVPARPKPAAIVVPSSVPPSASAALALSEPFPLPRLQYSTLDGKGTQIADHAGRPVLLNLWASWCRPCAAELGELARHEDPLRSLGLQVVALSVDGLGAESSGVDDARRLIAKIGFPFTTGMAGRELVDKLHLVHALLFDVPAELPVPTSFLIDRQGRLAAVYRGPVGAERLAEDVRRLDETHSTLPFPGRWFTPPPRRALSPLAWALFAAGHDADGVLYVDEHVKQLAGEPKFGELLSARGTALLKLGRISEAAEQFRDVLRREPRDLAALNNLAWLYATHPDPAVRDAGQAVRMAEQAAGLTHHRQASVLETLAAAYANVGRYQQAVATARQARALAQSAGDQPLEQSLRRQLELYSNGQPYRMSPR